MLRYLRDRQGWIFIDALIGMVIVALALTALALAYRQSAGVAMSATNYARAVYVAQQALDELKYQADGAGSLPSPSSQDVTVGNVTYHVAYSLPGTTIDRLGQVITNLYNYQVTVSWPESGRQMQLQVNGYYYLTPQ